MVLAIPEYPLCFIPFFDSVDALVLNLPTIGFESYQVGLSSLSTIVFFGNFYPDGLYGNKHFMADISSKYN